MPTARARRFSRGAAAIASVAASVVLALPVVSGVGAAPAAAKGKKSPVAVGFVLPLTGVFASNGQDEANGFKLGLKRYGTKVDGHPIKVTYLDAHGTPTTALTNAKELIHSDHVNVVEGALVSSSIVVVSPYVLSQGIPIDDLYVASTNMITNYKKYGMGLTSGWTGYQPSSIAGTYAYTTLKWRHVTTIGGDFGFGWQVIGGFDAEFNKLGGHVQKSIWVPINATTMSSYISQIPSTTNGLYIELSGSQASNFVNAYQSFGLKTKIPLLGITQITDQSALPAEKKTAAINTVVGAQYCTGIPSTLNQTFANAYHKTYGLWPAYYSDAGYVKAEILDAALKKVHGNVSGTKAEKKLGEAMRDVKVTAPRGPVKFTKSVFSVVQDSYICKVETVKGTLRNVPIKTYKNLPPAGLLSQSTFMKNFTQQSTGRPTPS